MRILFVMNYFYPYISGMTEHVRLLSKDLIQNHECEITIICQNHDRNKLSKREIIDGIEVIRAPIFLKLNKGMISIRFILKAISLSRKFDIVSLQLPMLESGAISLFIPKKKLFTVYQCDVNLPKTLINKFIVSVMDCSNKICLRRSKKIVVSSFDYANEARFLKKFHKKTIEIAPTVKMNTALGSADKKSSNINIGFLGRIVEEKGIFVLIKAFKIIQRKYPNANLLIAGDYQNIAGGSIYNELSDYIKENKIDKITFLGKLPEDKLPDFYSELTVFTLPSINSLEAFGIVQVEAMLNGTPVVASDLPGVRTIVKRTGMGEIFSVGSAEALAEALIKVITNRKDYVKPFEFICGLYGTNVITNKYLKEMNEIIL